MNPCIDQEAIENFLKDFGDNVRKIRKKKKLTQMDLASKINVDIQKISRIERGMYDFKFTSALILACLLDVGLLELISIPNLEYYQRCIIKEGVIESQKENDKNKI